MFNALMISCLFLFLAQTSYSQELVWSTVLKDIRKRYPDVHQLSTDSLAAWLADDDRRQPLLIDAREPAEYEMSHLAGALQLDPETTDFRVFTDLDKNTPIVVYCSVGYRSSKIADMLSAEGFSNVSNLEGSIFTWANEGRPIVRKDEPVKAVHPYNKIWGMLLKREYRGDGAPE